MLHARMTPQPSPTRRRAVSSALCLALGLLPFLPGCASTPASSERTASDEFKPANYRAAAARLPGEVRRVALLPLTCDDATPETTAGRDAMAPILAQELAATGRFELLELSAADLAIWTGKSAWTAEEPLPSDLLTRLHERTGCDAVVFARLTRFRAYPPLVVGLRLRLVQVNPTHETLWSADEVLDASDPAVNRGARRHQSAQRPANAALADSSSILYTPRLFGRYAARTLTSTLPAR